MAIYSKIHKTQGLSRAQQETEVNKRFVDFYNVWCNVVLGFHDIATKTRTRIVSYAGDYSKLCGTAFWIYAGLVFLFNVL